MIPARRSTSRAVTGALAGLAVLALAAVAAAETTVEQVHGMIDSLAAPAFADREAATDELIVCAIDIEPVVTERFIAGGLTPEQTARLETIVHTRFSNAPRAALGVGFARELQPNNQPRPIAVTLESVKQDFPCAATLKPGDIIRVVDGFELPPTGGDDHVRTAILSHLPGEELELVIERDNRRSFVRIPLGDFARLNAPMPSATILKRAWELRRARLGLTMHDDAISAVQCVIDGQRGELGTLAKRDSPKIQAGGSPDNGAALLHELRSRASMVTKNRIAATNTRRFAVKQPNERLAIQQARAEAAHIKSALNRLETRLQQAETERARHQRILERDDIGETQKQSTAVALTQVEARIAGIKGEIRTINEAVEAANKGEAPQE